MYSMHGQFGELHEFQLHNSMSTQSNSRMLTGFIQDWIKSFLELALMNHISSLNLPHYYILPL